jgi:hypothetical protein
MYNTIPKSEECLTINYVVNVVGTTLPLFDIFKGERIQNDYMQSRDLYGYVIKSMDDCIFFK